MRVSVKINNASATTPVEPTTASVPTTVTNPTVPSTTSVETDIILINGKAYKVGENNFHIDAEFGNHSKGSYDYIDIGNGVWYCPEIESRLIGFDITVGTDDENETVVITEDFNWSELFGLDIIPCGTFDGTMWSGTITNTVNEITGLHVHFLYSDNETDFRYLKDIATRGVLRKISSFAELIEHFPEFDRWMNHKGGRAKNPFI